MLRKTFTYENYDGVTVTRDFYFNLSKAELQLREIGSDGEWSKTLERIRMSDKGSVVIPEFEQIIAWTYGVKTPDGDSIVKNEANLELFKGCPAYSLLIEELLSTEGAAAEFIKGVLPAGMVAQAEAQGTIPGFRPGADTSRPTPPQNEQISAPQEVQAPIADTSRRALREGEAQIESAPRTDLWGG